MSCPSFSSTDNLFFKRSRSLYDAGELSGLGFLEMTGEAEKGTHIIVELAFN